MALKSVHLTGLAECTSTVGCIRVVNEFVLYMSFKREGCPLAGSSPNPFSAACTNIIGRALLMCSRYGASTLSSQLWFACCVVFGGEGVNEYGRAVTISEGQW